jgi:hypothetical protein
MAASTAAAPLVVLFQEPAPAGTARSSVLTLINSAVGAGVLSFGFAFRCTGWAVGLLLTFFIAAVEAFTLYVLSRYAERSGTKTYSALVRASAPACSARRCTAPCCPLPVLMLSESACCLLPAAGAQDAWPSSQRFHGNNSGFLSVRLVRRILDPCW